jgi:predicted ATPase/class 3 adenylate cyclase
LLLGISRRCRLTATSAGGLMLLVFLLTDIEGSTQLWENHQAAMGQALVRHDAILRELIEKHGGHVIKHTGDGVFAVFEAGRPLDGALALQQRFARETWQPLPAMRIRVALNAGVAERRGEDYFGPAVNCTARLLAAAWGGQILLTAAVAQIASLPEGCSLKDLGRHVLQDLSEPQLIYTLLHPDLPAQSFPPLRTLPYQEHNLPPQPTHFVGRERELVQIQRRLGQPDCRLLNMVGPGGIGKTRLALQAAAEQIAFFKHGVYFVPLQSVDSAELAVPVIAETIGFAFDGQQPPRLQLFNKLQDKQILLVLDNFEQVSLGGALLSELLQRAPRLKLMVTSRERLNLAEENCLVMRGMYFPQRSEAARERMDELAKCEAVRLFLENARRISPDFQLVESDHDAMLRICRLLGGMPLGLEMAAAWVRMISLTEIAIEIERSVDFLVSSERGVPERHYRLRAVIDYLWQFLSDSERSVLRRLSLFSGGFEREAAEAVAGASLFFLLALVDRALLRQNVNGRYEMHELLRQYAAAKVQGHTLEKAQASGAHAAYYAALLERLEPELRGKGYKTAQAQISAEMSNVRRAWQWALAALAEASTNAAALAVIEQSAEALFFFFDTRSLFREGEELFGQAASILEAAQTGAELAPDQTDPHQFQTRQLLGKIMCRQGIFFYQLGFHSRSCDLLQLAVVEARAHANPPEEGLALTYLGSIAYVQGNLERARDLFQEAQALYQQGQASWGLVLCLRFRGNVAYASAHFEEAERHYRDSHDLAQQLNYQRGVADSLNNLGLVTCSLGHYALSEQYYQQGLALYKDLKNHKGVALSLNNLAHNYVLLGRYQEAVLLYQESLNLHRLHGAHFELALALKNLGDVALLLGNYSEAEHYYREDLACNEAAENQQAIAFGYSNLGDLARKRGDYRLAAHFYGEAHSRMERSEHAAGLAHVLANMGTLARVREEYGEARHCYEQSLTLNRRNGNREGIGYLMNELGLLALAQQAPAEAMDYFEQGLAVFSEGGISWGISLSLNHLVDGALCLRDSQAARRHLRAALELMQQVQAPPLMLQTIARSAAFLWLQVGLKTEAFPHAGEQQALAATLARLCCTHEAAGAEIRERGQALLLAMGQAEANSAAAPLPADLGELVQRLWERVSD